MAIERAKKVKVKTEEINAKPADDLTIDSVLRPSDWDEYIGQESVKKNLRIILEAAKKRKEPVDHLLFYGQAGLGKTTMANLVAKDMGVPIKITTGPAIEKMGDLAAILSNLEPNDILFVDEIHRLNRLVEEVLYPAMESRKLHIVIGKGAGARTISLDLPPFTLVGATTRVNLLSEPLRSRFGAILRLDYYNEADIERIIERSAKILGIKIEKEALKILARACRFTPRIANRLLKRVRDYAEVSGHAAITKDVAEKTLEVLEIDSMGLELYDRILLQTIIDKYKGGPVGVNTMAATLNEDRDTIENVYEPYLIKLGLLKRTPSGRVVEPLAYEHLQKKKKESLF